jgi:hypothetical protein
MKLDTITFSTLSGLSEVQNYLTKQSTQLAQILNNGLFFSDNFNTSIKPVTFSSSNSELRIEHNIGRVPTGYLILKKSAGADVYDGISENTDQYIFLRATASMNVTLMIF